MAAHRRSDRRRDDLYAAGLRKRAAKRFVTPETERLRFRGSGVRTGGNAQFRKVNRLATNRLYSQRRIAGRPKE